MNGISRYTVDAISEGDPCCGSFAAADLSRRKEGIMSVKMKRNILTILIVVFAGVFAISAYMLVNYFMETGSAEAEFEEIRKELQKPQAEGLEPREASDKY